MSTRGVAPVGASKDLLAGGAFLAFGGLFAAHAYASLRPGTAAEMGPGYFPLIVGSLLCLLGAVICVRALFWATGSRLQHIGWRGLALVAAAPVLFGVLIRPFGLIAALFFAVLISCFASRTMSLLKAAAIAIVLSAVCVAIFRFGLGLNLALFAWPGN